MAKKYAIVFVSDYVDFANKQQWEIWELQKANAFITSLKAWDWDRDDIIFLAPEKLQYDPDGPPSSIQSAFDTILGKSDVERFVLYIADQCPCVAENTPRIIISPSSERLASWIKGKLMDVYNIAKSQKQIDALFSGRCSFNLGDEVNDPSWNTISSSNILDIVYPMIYGDPSNPIHTDHEDPFFISLSMDPNDKNQDFVDSFHKEQVRMHQEPTPQMPALWEKV